ncbi:MAG TPA: hypothetical protein VIA61_07825 [Methylomirabilota bacterium]
MPGGEGPYSAAWRRYRRWSLAFWLVFVLYLPGLAFLSQAMGWSRNGGGPVFVAAFVWMIAFAAIGYVKWNFECPRCGELFFRKLDARPWRQDWYRNPFARHCMHCGLAKWAAA